MRRVWFMMFICTMLLWGCGKESAGPGQNEIPRADAGENREAWAYTEVLLDGSQSSDPDGDRLQYLWSQDPNNPEEVILAYRPDWGEREEFIARRIFTTTKAGTYRFVLVVDDGRTSSPADTVIVEVEGSVRPPKGMVYVPAGEFVMGYDGSKFDGDRPEHRVYVDAFFIDKYEVTNREFREFMDVVGGVGYSIYGGTAWGANDQPAHAVIWDDARRYAEWKGKRLPTEAEWEKAARGIDGRLYPWGDEFFHVENGDTTYYTNVSGIDDGYPYTAPVGSFPQGASPYGVMDMVGNVAEWVEDWFDKDYYKNSPYENPTGGEGVLKVHRGGSIRLTLDDLEFFRTYHREGVSPSTLNIVQAARIGIRCAMDAE